MTLIGVTLTVKPYQECVRPNSRNSHSSFNNSEILTDVSTRPFAHSPMTLTSTRLGGSHRTCRKRNLIAMASQPCLRTSAGNFRSRLSAGSGRPFRFLWLFQFLSYALANILIHVSLKIKGTDEPAARE